jgi:hypothetical protein
MGSIDIDPASNEIAQLTVKSKVFYTKETNGLNKKWCGNAWLNPPYSALLIKEFCDKLVLEKQIGNVSQFVTLTNNATETTWFNTIASVSSAFCLPRRRIKFLDPNGVPVGAPLQGQVLCYSGLNVKNFIQEFSKYGVCAMFCHQEENALIL